MTDREIIVEIAEKVMGWSHEQIGTGTHYGFGVNGRIYKSEYVGGFSGWSQLPWNPLANYNDTFEVLGKLGYWCGGNSLIGEYWISLGPDEYHIWTQKDADFRRAVCLAALAEKGVKVE